MTNVLIPTDFSLESLRYVNQAIAGLDRRPLNIILFHAFSINCMAPDVLGNRRTLPYAELVTEEFRNTCRKIKSNHPRVVSQINIRHMYGDTVAAFRNFIDANDIDLILCDDSFIFQPVSPASVNPDKMFKKAGIPVVNPRQRKTTIVRPSTAPLADTVAPLIR